MKKKVIIKKLNEIFVLKGLQILPSLVKKTIEVKMKSVMILCFGNYEKYFYIKGIGGWGKHFF